MLTTLKVVGTVLLAALAIWRGLRLRSDARGVVVASPTVGSVAGWGIVFVAWLLLVLPSVGQVEEGERGVVLNLGAATGRVVDPGIYWVMPFVESVERMSVLTQAESVKAEGASKDLQIVHAEITVNYALDPGRVVEVFKTLRHEYLPRVIRPAIEEAVKAATAEYKAEELIVQRAAVKDRIRAVLATRLTERGFVLDTINITDFDFSATFNESIEAKVTATQAALKAQNDLERVKAEAQQQIERAKAEAEALKAQREAVTAELIELRRVEALLKSIEKWDGRLPYFVSAGTGQSPVPVMDVFREAPK